MLLLWLVQEQHLEQRRAAGEEKQHPKVERCDLCPGKPEDQRRWQPDTEGAEKRTLF